MPPSDNIAGASMVSVHYFRQELLFQFSRASSSGMLDLIVVAGELFRSSGGYPGSVHGLSECCKALSDEMAKGDLILINATEGRGMTVRFRLPRTL
jgi:hypothetical protein